MTLMAEWMEKLEWSCLSEHPKANRITLHHLPQEKSVLYLLHQLGFVVRSIQMVEGPHIFWVFR
jgi:hypothetical protein